MSESFIQRRSGPPPEPDRDSKGIPIITKAYLRKQCEDQEQYATPHLNTRLYLASKGFQRVEALEEYVNVRALYLNNNVLHSISGLADLRQLRSLFLQNNFITRIEGLEGLIYLETLNLSHNQITQVEGLADLLTLSNLDLSHNKLTEASGFDRLALNTSLTTLNLAANAIDRAEEEVIAQLRQVSALKVLYLKQNGVVAAVKNYRKRLIHELPHLVYLDDRPITPAERALASGFITGGKDGEAKAREALQAERDRSHKAYLCEVREARAKFQKARTADLEHMRDKIDKENLQNVQERHRLETVEGDEVVQARLAMLDREIAADRLQMDVLDDRIAQCKTEVIPDPEPTPDTAPTPPPGDPTEQDVPFQTVPTESDMDALD